MPWNQVTLMEEKHRLVSLASTEEFTVLELGAEFEVSLKTGHRWLRRYAVGSSSDRATAAARKGQFQADPVFRF
ncbi:MAG: hypothetical protein NTV51_12445 [Verrucomicrobia bacterium]|nr:hypothetical protein [Verrucomicrobiota bacterium]